MKSASAFKCPVCNKITNQKYRPFCSSRCKLIDLGNWIDGSYRLPTDDVPEEADIINFESHLSKNK
ncbi:MAG: DNA gyrase inhibitor YacG [Thalassobaculaceae bacterium]